tara:strand:+ start:141 stop:317 length:177 start_codon:yes stop_codon:yes gene_type:complete
MPFSLFAARCIYVARQPLKYRQDVIKRIYIAKVTSLATICTVKMPEILSTGTAFTLTY